MTEPGLTDLRLPPRALSPEELSGVAEVKDEVIPLALPMRTGAVGKMDSREAEVDGLFGGPRALELVGERVRDCLRETDELTGASFRLGG
jgi:hypothetical protein